MQLFEYTQKNPDFDFDFDYEHSTIHYADLDAFYKDVYHAYYKNPKAIDTALVEKLANKKGYYYLVEKSTGDLYSNIPKLKTSSDFYQKVYFSRSIASYSEPVWRDRQVFFHILPPFQDEISIGMDDSTFSSKSDAFIMNSYKTHMPFMITMGICLLIELLGLTYLAVICGRKPNSNELHYHQLDAIFLDVFLVAWAFVEALKLEIYFSNIHDFNTTGQLIATMIFATLFGFTGLLYFTMVSKRFKSRQLFKHTLIYFVLNHTLVFCYKKVKGLIMRIKDGPFQLLPIALTLCFIAINAFTIIVGFILSASFGFVGFIVGGFIYLSAMGLLMAYLIYQDQQLERVLMALGHIASGNLDYKLPMSGTKQFARLAEQLNKLTNGFKEAVEKELKSERMKSELITNVSHDIKTPLTSIINYVDLLKTQGLDAEDAPKYLEILDQKSQRLKHLTEDLFEASKASSGNLQVITERLKFQDFILQATGEFMERFEAANLKLNMDLPEQALHILADGRHLWRILENVLLNVYKYAAPNTRVYLSLSKSGTVAELVLKNISESPLNIPPEELLERFSRGDASRNTEGSGLGLSIAKSLTELQKGSFDIQTDGDLFKVILRLPLDTSPN
jgi:signal transduction histidine kinase